MPVVDDRPRAHDPIDEGTPRDRYWKTIVHELFRREYRILHIATHGHFDAEHPERSGALITPDLFMSSAIVGSLPVIPDFVFFNCCHLGRIDTVPTARIAASVAKTVMEHGVRAVVAAGWAVDDADAMKFATTLYDCLCGGAPFGEAVREARHADLPGRRTDDVEHLGCIPVLWRAGMASRSTPGESRRRRRPRVRERRGACTRRPRRGGGRGLDEAGAAAGADEVGRTTRRPGRPS